MTIKLQGLQKHIQLLLVLGLVVPGAAQAMRDQLVLKLTSADGAVHQFPAIEFSHDIAPEIDTASGLPTGKRQHKPFSVTKPVDNVSATIFNILVNNENITEWRLDTYRTDPQGTTRLFKTTELVNPDVCGVSSVLAQSDMREREQVAFCYDKVIWTWQDGGVTAEDDWETPVAAQ